MDNVRFAVCTTTVVHNGVPVPLVEGRAYAADDPVVRQLPHLFVDTPVVYDHRGSIVTPHGHVEEATANPGEKRGRRRD